ncbi:MAG: ATP-binding protein [Gammaproteobacteria bacterium]
MKQETGRLLIKAALDIAQAQLESRQNAIEVKLAAGDVTLRGDSARLAQALGNVLVNASKYSATGAPITISATHDAERARITIADVGLGIPDAMLEKVFEPFVQVPPSGGRTHDGLGICP